MPEDQAAKYRAALLTLVEKMKTFEVKTFEQARAYLRSVAFTNAALNKLLSDDAAGRSLSFKEAIDWYSEVARGLSR
jgi:hypothetical protein